MKTLPLLLLILFAFGALSAIYVWWGAGRAKAQRRLYESLSSRFGLRLFTATGVFGGLAPPEIRGVYPGRKVRVGTGALNSGGLTEPARARACR